MPRKMADVRRASERSAELANSWRQRDEQAEKRQTEQNEAKEQKMAQEQANTKMTAAVLAVPDPDEAILAQARAILAQRGEKFTSSPQPSPFVAGDGLTHGTGKKRLNVEREGGCVCGCGQTPEKKRSRFIPGHDARMYRVAKAYNGKLGEEEQKAAHESVTDRQLAYLRGRGLI